MGLSLSYFFLGVAWIRSRRRFPHSSEGLRRIPIPTIAGRPIRRQKDLVEAVKGRLSGDVVSVDLERGGKAIERRLPLAAKPDPPLLLDNYRPRTTARGEAVKKWRQGPGNTTLASNFLRRPRRACERRWSSLVSEVRPGKTKRDPEPACPAVEER